MKKNILFVSNEVQKGGATKSLIYLAKFLMNNHEIYPIILLNKNGYLLDMCKKENIKYIKLPYKAFSLGEGSTRFRKLVKKMLIPYYKLSHYIFNNYALKRIIKYYDINKVDLVHTNTNRDDFGAMLAKKYNLKHIWHLREFGDLDYKCINLNKNYIDFMNQNTDRFIAISNAIKNSFINKGLDGKKIEVIYNGININNIKISNTKRNEKIKILFAGGITESKGQYQLINAFKYIDEYLRKKIYVDFYGDVSSEYLSYLKSIIIENGLERNFSFYDYTINFDKIISEYDIGIMCSKSEAFGRVTCEYMAHGLITIASNTGANEEIIDNEINGFIYKYNDYSDLARIITNIITMDDKKKDTIKYNAIKKISEMFTDEINGNNIYKLYLSIKGENYVDF